MPTNDRFATDTDYSAVKHSFGFVPSVGGDGNEALIHPVHTSNNDVFLQVILSKEGGCSNHGDWTE